MFSPKWETVSAHVLSLQRFRKLGRTGHRTNKIFRIGGGYDEMLSAGHGVTSHTHNFIITVDICTRSAQDKPYPNPSIDGIAEL